MHHLFPVRQTCIFYTGIRRVLTSGNRERDCQGSNWQNYGDAATVPEFLNDHIWSFRNECYGCPNPFSPCQYTEDDGTCSFGYTACLQKMGCGNRAGEFDCGGHAAGAF